LWLRLAKLHRKPAKTGQQDVGYKRCICSHGGRQNEPCEEASDQVVRRHGGEPAKYLAPHHRVQAKTNGIRQQGVWCIERHYHDLNQNFGLGQYEEWGLHNFHHHPMLNTSISMDPDGVASQGQQQYRLQQT